MSHPRRIGRYQIKSTLGSGSMATVYRARDTAMQRDVAVKVLHERFHSDAVVRERFLREAQSIARLDHAAIVPVYDAGQVDSHIYIAMRLMEGGSLAELVAQVPVSLKHIIKIMERVCAALDAAHQQQIVHRDVKPENILFDRYGQSFLADFGVVKLVEAGASITGDTLVGTPAYMSPEQVNGSQRIDGRSDLYSLGIVLFEMLTGELPFHADTAMRMAMQHVLAPIPQIRTANSHLPRGWQKIINRGMAKDRTKRYQSGAEFSRAVRAFLRSRQLNSKLARRHYGARSGSQKELRWREA